MWLPDPQWYESHVCRVSCEASRSFISAIDVALHPRSGSITQTEPTTWVDSVTLSGFAPGDARDLAQIGPRPTRLRPMTRFTTTTVRIAPMVATTIELTSNGP